MPENFDRLALVVVGCLFFLAGSLLLGILIYFRYRKRNSSKRHGKPIQAAKPFT